MVRACWGHSARTTGIVRVVRPHIARLPGWTTDVVPPGRTHPVRTTARTGVITSHVARLSRRATHMVCARWTGSVRTTRAVRVIAPHVARLPRWTTDVVGAVRTRPLRAADRVRGVVALERDRERNRSVWTTAAAVVVVVRHHRVRRVVDPRGRAVDLLRRGLRVARRAEVVPDRRDQNREAREVEIPGVARDCNRRRRAEGKEDRNDRRGRPTTALREQPPPPRRARSLHASFHSFQQMTVGHVAISGEDFGQILEIGW
jgi:hypothetical protein